MAIRAWMQRKRERGQSIVLLAIAMVVLLLFAGLALDAGILYIRRIQLSQAVDAAALACVTEMPDLAATTTRAKQFMRANGIDPDTQLAVFTVTQGLPAGMVVPGVVPEHVATITARWDVRPYFMQLIGFRVIPLTEQASAEYRAVVDMFSSQTGESGKLGAVNLSVFGPKQTPGFGDAYTCPTRHMDGKPKDYNPIPDQNTYPNPNHAVLQDGYPFRIYIPPSFNGTVRIEILDPETYNAPPPSRRISDTDYYFVVITNTFPVTVTQVITVAASKPSPNRPNVTHTYANYSNSQQNAFAIDRAKLSPADSDSNRFWFVRMDENRLYNQTPSTYSDAYNTTTEFRLYYFNRANERVNIATYVGQPNNDDNTDLRWVCPGGSAPQDPQSHIVGYGKFAAHPSFEVNLADLDEIVVNEDGSRSLYLDVQAVDGWSENGFDLWAGPATDANRAVPANVNERNIWIDRQRLLGVLNPHDSQGITVYGRGVLPLNVNQDTTYTVTLAYIPPEARGIDLCVYHWDTDVGSQSVHYWFEGYPKSVVTGTLSAGNSWTAAPNNYNFDEGCDRVPVPTDFVGGYLYARYQMGAQDTSTWLMQYQKPIPSMSFVRLIK